MAGLCARVAVVQPLIEDGELAIRPLQDNVSAYGILAKWLTDTRVLEFYEGRDNPFPIDRIKEKYAPRVLGSENVVPCLLVFQSAPIGYAQFYPIPEEAGVFGIDQFIGEAGLWNRGLGTHAVSLLLQYLFRVKGARKVIVDPHVTNARAIRCYEKCGFRKVKLLPRHELHEGSLRDSWLMEVALQ
jgi:aminoglycoside 6'-N-acetyltransferase